MINYLTSIFLLFFSSFCSIDHTVKINDKTNSARLNYQFTDIYVTKHFKQDDKFFLFFRLKVLNTSKEKIIFNYKDLKLLDANTKIIMLPKSSLIASVVIEPINLNPADTVDFDSYIEIDELNKDLDFFGIAN